MLDELYDLLKDDRKYSNWSSKQSVISRLDELKDEIDELRAGIRKNDLANIKEEAGDILWDLLAVIVALEDELNISSSEIVEGITKKMKRRKPFIFEKRRPSLEEEKRVWREGKALDHA